MAPPGGLPSGLCRRRGAVSRAPKSPQARHMDSTSSYVALRVGDAQRRRKYREKRRGRGKKNANIHTRTRNRLWGWTFSVSHEETCGIWRRFLKTFRRKGEFSAEKLNLPYSSGPIWDVSLLTAPQGTAVIFCAGCTPRNTLLNQRMSARRSSADRAGSRAAGGFHPRPAPSPRTQAAAPLPSPQHIN